MKIIANENSNHVMKFSREWVENTSKRKALAKKVFALSFQMKTVLTGSICTNTSENV